MALEDDAQPFAAGAFAIALARVKSAPLELTEHDFDQLTMVSPALEAEARAAMLQAQLAILRAPAPPVTKAGEPGGAAADPFLQKHGPRPVTFSALDMFADALIDVIKKSITPMKDQIATLEQRNGELEARVLELEAQAAAARPETPDAAR